MTGLLSSSLGTKMTEGKQPHSYLGKLAGVLNLGKIQTEKDEHTPAEAQKSDIPGGNTFSERMHLTRAKAACKRGDFALAVRLFIRLYEWAFKNLGPDHETTLEYGLDAAQCLREERKLDGALSCYTQLNRIAITKLGETHTLTLRAREGMKKCKHSIQQTRGFIMVQSHFFLVDGESGILDECTAFSRIERLKEIAVKLLQRKKLTLARSFFNAWFEEYFEHNDSDGVNVIEEIRDYANSLPHAGGQQEAFEIYRLLIRVTTNEMSTGSGNYDLTVTLKDFARYLDATGQHISAKSILALAPLKKSAHRN